MTIRLYRSTDAGAPQLSNSGSGGSYLTVLRACLVDGYGTRTPQGWTMPFSDLPNNKAVFRGVSGVGNLLRVDDNFDYRWAEVNGYESMTDVDTGIGVYPNKAQLDIPVNTVFKHYVRGTSSAFYDEWMLVADDEHFYYIGLDTNVAQSYPSCGFFGRYDSVEPTYSSPYALGGVEENPANSSYTSFAWHAFMDQQEMWQARNHFDDQPKPTELIRDYEEINYASPNPISGKLDFERINIRSILINPYIRYGQMPNLVRMLATLDRDFRTGDIYPIGSENYILFCRSNGVYALKFESDVG